MNYSLIEHYMIIGTAGQLSLLFLVTTLALAVFILIWRSGLSLRLSLIPLSLVPILLGIAGAATNAGQLIQLMTEPRNPDLTFSHHEVLHVLPVTAGESAILLVVSSLLLAFTPRTPDSRPTT